MLLCRVIYENGSITDGPTSCAGNQGTTITFDDIFYNNPIRLKTLKFPSDEFQKIFDVTAKYSVHNFTISFTLKKFGENNSIKTAPSTSPMEIIRMIYGSNVANSLLPVECSNERLKFTMDGFVSKSDYSGKKRQLLLFINHRLVESKSLKRAIFDNVYSCLLPSNVQPFVYISLEMDPNNIDVNVSPTKNEVNFLHEDAIVEQVKQTVEEKLLGTNETRKLYTQQLLPGAEKVINDKSFGEKDRIYAKDMVRTDAKTQTIFKFFQQEEKSGLGQDYQSQSPKNISHIISSPTQTRIKKKQANVSELTSINELKAEIQSKCHESLKDNVGKLKFVGNASRAKSLVQCENILYLCDTKKLCIELFYQQSVANFENFDELEFDDPLKILELAKIGLDMKECELNEDEIQNKDELAQLVNNVLVDQRVLLEEYFSISITADGHLKTLPTIIPSFMPLMSHLPIFLIRLACDVNYKDEKECFKSICRELAMFYSRLSLTSSEDDFYLLNDSILYPAIRKHLLPPTQFLNDGTFLKLTSLQELYKVFERC